MTMMHAPTGVAVVATQLPGTDRRALSQAWYSALHLTERGHARPHSPFGFRAASDAGEPQAPASARAASMHVPPRAMSRPRAGHSAKLGLPEERRAPCTALTRRIVRALAPRPRAPIVPSASLAIKVGAGRVHLLVRTDGGTTRIVALCAPALKARVESALAQARFTLAAAGVAFAADVR